MMKARKKKWSFFRRDSFSHIPTSAGALPTRISLSRNSGFTLAEMIVSVGLFSIVVTVSTGALLQVLATNQRAQAIETVMNNLDFALQQMGRDIRVGTQYSCGATGFHQDSPNGAPCTSFSFTSHPSALEPSGHEVVYVFDANTHSVSRSIDAGATYYPITASQIYISNLGFYVSGSDPVDSLQPKVLLVLQGYVSLKGARTNFNLQTTVSQRLLDR